MGLGPAARTFEASDQAVRANRAVELRPRMVQYRFQLALAFRQAGDYADAIEQLRHNRLIRPTAIYEGAQNQTYVPIEKR